MKVGIIIFLVTLGSVCFGQDNFELTTTEDSDTKYWSKYLNEQINSFELPQIKKDSEFVFRSWNSNSMLEIKKVNDQITGRIHFFVYEIWEGDNKADTFVKEHTLTQQKSIELYEFLIKSKNRKIPSDKFIDTWSKGFDGRTYVYQLKEKNTYSLKKYWTPEIQEGITEAEYILLVNDEIAKVVELEKLREEFQDEIPFISYTSPGSHLLTIKSTTRKELRKYKRDRRKRMRTIANKS